MIALCFPTTLVVYDAVQSAVLQLKKKLYANSCLEKSVFMSCSASVVGLGGLGRSLLEKACPRGAGIGKLCPKHIFSKSIVVVVVVVVGLGGQALRCGGCWISSWTTSPNIAFQIHNGACHTGL